MQTIKQIQIGKEYSIKGVIVKADHIISYGKKLFGVKTIYFFDKKNNKFKCTQWNDGTIYRIIRL